MLQGPVVGSVLSAQKVPQETTNRWTFEHAHGVIVINRNTRYNSRCLLDAKRQKKTKYFKEHPVSLIVYLNCFTGLLECSQCARGYIYRTKHYGKPSLCYSSDFGFYYWTIVFIKLRYSHSLFSRPAVHLLSRADATSRNFYLSHLRVLAWKVIHFTRQTTDDSSKTAVVTMSRLSLRRFVCQSNEGLTSETSVNYNSF
jgi:hypothetical protein